MANPTYLRFIDRNPDSAAAFKALVAETTKPGALDARTKQLIFLACTAVSGYGDGLIAHIDGILADGGTPDEIREALAVTIPIAGIMPVLKVYDVVEDHLSALQARTDFGPACR
jgi:AhpD family alkylhydroperoxidase